jgi:hypothetical protein
VKVISGLADIDFNVGSIARQGSYLVVRDKEAAGLSTVVYVSSQDIVAGLKALLASPAALRLVLSAPFRRKAAAAQIESRIARDRVNNPWV